MNEAIKQKEIMSIKTRFGSVLMSQAESVFFKKGLIGFSNLKDFYLISHLFKKYKKFKLLQSVSEPSLSLILYYPEEELENFFERKILQDICSNFDFNSDKTSIFLVVNIKIIEGQQKIYVNNKAPILLDNEKFRAVQYIIANNKYEMRRELLL